MTSLIDDLDSRRGQTRPGPQVERNAAERYHPFPLTDVQRAYWMGRSGAFALGGVGTHLYWELEAVDLDMPRLEDAWNRLIERHDMLRAVVSPEGNQRVLEHVPRYRIAITTGEQAPDLIQAVLERVREEMSHQVFALDQWPLFDLRVTPRGAGMFRLHLSFDCVPVDGWSLQVLFKEWIHYYNDLEYELAPLKIGFRECTLAPAVMEQDPAYQRAQEYWTSQVDDMPGAPELPLARDPSTITSPRFRRRELRLSSADLQRLKKTASRTHTTLSTLLMQAYSEVLARWSRARRFTLNLTLFDRQPIHDDVDQVVGDFTSLMLTTVDVRQDGTFQSRASKLQEQLWKDMDHRVYHGLQVIRELSRQGRGASVVFTSALIGSGFDLGVLGKLGFGLTQTSQVWLDHQLYEVNGTLALVWDAVEELFPAGMLDAMFASYEELVRALASDRPESPWRLPRAQAESRRAANATEAELPAGLLQDCLAAGLRHGPERPALIAPDRVVTYLDLDTSTNRIAHVLRARGARPGKLVAIMLEKGWRQVQAVLAVLKAGAAYLPIDPDLPPERIAHLLECGQVTLALTTSAFVAHFTFPDAVEPLAVDEPQLWQHADQSPLPPLQTPLDLAYVIYTSGSTGKPKGVMIAHAAALNTIADINKRFHVQAQDRVLALSALSFDLSVYDIFGLLAAGGAVVFPPHTATRDPDTWLALIRKHGISLWNTVPALMEMLVESADLERQPLSSLRCVMLSGDWIPLSLPERIRKAAPNANIISLGGATEASIWSIFYPIHDVAPHWKSIPYGKPLANQTFHVLDELLEDRPDWVPGELYIGGAGLALGYFREPSLTSEKFFIHPKTGERLYRTGDWGRYLPDGNIEFLGRIDAQVKIRGHRIECGEIEAALAAHPSVRECVVTALKDQKNHAFLIAYVVTRDTPQQSSTLIEQLQAFVAAKLPAYMVPPNFVFLTALPLSRNGKVDLKALPPPHNLMDRTKPSRPPQNPTEEALLLLVARELGRDAIGVEDNFFEIGGDSIHAMRILYLIGRAFDAKLSMERMLEDPTVAGLAMAVEEEIIAQLEADENASLPA